MAASAQPYAGLPINLFGGATAGEARKIDWLSDTIKMMLCTVLYVPDQATHKFKSSITNEVVGAGYVAGGVTLAGKTLVYDVPSKIMILDCNNPLWAVATITARYGVIYDDREAAAADKELIGYIDFGTDQSTAGVDFEVEVDPTGLLRLAIGVAA